MRCGKIPGQTDENQHSDSQLLDAADVSPTGKINNLDESISIDLLRPVK
jgi:hypothetical protein